MTLISERKRKASHRPGWILAEEEFDSCDWLYIRSFQSQPLPKDPGLGSTKRSTSFLLWMQVRSDSQWCLIRVYRYSPSMWVCAEIRKASGKSCANVFQSWPLGCFPAVPMRKCYVYPPSHLLIFASLHMQKFFLRPRYLELGYLRFPAVILKSF